jgi:hypothetical protein
MKNKFDRIWKEMSLSGGTGGKLEKLSRQSFSGLSSESRNFGFGAELLPTRLEFR